MPLGPGVRYRVVTRGGEKIRLAFKGDEVVEAKKLHSLKKKRKAERDAVGQIAARRK